MKEEYYMQLALLEAKKAFALGEVPVGAVIVYEDTVIGRGYNRRNTLKNPLAHAEIMAIDEAARFMGDWRLENCQMYVTVEPCPMCAGAIIQARIPIVYFGTRNKKAGCGGSILNVLQDSRFNHQAQIVEGTLQEECSSLMVEFFQRFRKNKTAQA